MVTRAFAGGGDGECPLLPSAVRQRSHQQRDVSMVTLLILRIYQFNLKILIGVGFLCVCVHRGKCPLVVSVCVILRNKKNDKDAPRCEHFYFLVNHNI